MRWLWNLVVRFFVSITLYIPGLGRRHGRGRVRGGQGRRGRSRTPTAKIVFSGDGLFSTPSDETTETEETGAPSTSTSSSTTPGEPDDDTDHNPEVRIDIPPPVYPPSPLRAWAEVWMLAVAILCISGVASGLQVHMLSIGPSPLGAHSNSQQKLLEEIHVEREGRQIDGADLETPMLEDPAAYYSREASNWILEDSCPEYMLKHLTDEGTALVQQAEDAAAALSKVGVPHSLQAENAGSSHEQALKEAFEVFLNKGVAGSSSAELLATFCGNILKKGGSEKPSDEAIEDSLEKVVKLLAYVSDKDLFAEFSRKKLSPQLLFDKSANDDHERSILTKLKQQCGGQFTSKMEGMVTDLTLAKENQTHFEEYLGQTPDSSPGLDLTVTVLSIGFWPSYKSSDLNLPDEMAAALMLFNASDRLSYSETATQLNLAEEDLVRVLQSLSCAKYKILIKDPSSGTVTTTDHFSFNSNFTDRRIPFPPVDARKKVVKDVDKDRRYAIDASILRIMKSWKVLVYQQLITECVEQLSLMFQGVCAEDLEDMVESIDVTHGEDSQARYDANADFLHPVVTFESWCDLTLMPRVSSMSR